MSVKSITTDDLRRMKDSEGLILQGCGGDLNEWVDGINDMLTKEGILKDGFKFEECMSFEHDETTCLLFPFDNVSLDIGKFAIWRINTYSTFGGTWLSDYVPNRLGGFAETENEVKPKPDCPLIGQDGNIFNLMGIAAKTLRQNGMSEEATQMCDRIRSSGDYYKALNIIGEYVNITSAEDQDIYEDFEERMDM